MEVIKMMPGRIFLRVTILAMACSAGAASFSTSNARPQDHSAGQDPPKTSGTNSGHNYTPSSNWNVCGVIPYSGYDGWTHQGGAAWKCDDGAIVYDVTDEFTSARAAKAESLARLQEKRPERKPWRIAQTEPLGAATIIEFAEPAPVINEAAPCKWAVMWKRNEALFLIYGPDRDHVVDFYQRRGARAAKK
jgi:hypothetical protein